MSVQTVLSTTRLIGHIMNITTIYSRLTTVAMLEIMLTAHQLEIWNILHFKVITNCPHVCIALF